MGPCQTETLDWFTLRCVRVMLSFLLLCILHAAFSTGGESSGFVTSQMETIWVAGGRSCVLNGTLDIKDNVLVFLSSGSGVLLKPVFTKQPGSVVFPLHPSENHREVVFSCEAQGHPPPFYR